MFFASARGIVRGLKFFAVCYGLRFAHLQEFLRPLFSFCFSQNEANSVLSQFLHSLNVNSAFAFTKIYSRCFGGPAEALAEAGLAHLLYIDTMPKNF